METGNGHKISTISATDTTNYDYIIIIITSSLSLSCKWRHMSSKQRYNLTDPHPRSQSQEGVSLTVTDCPTGRWTILLWPNNMGQWSVAKVGESVSVSKTAPRSRDWHCPTRGSPTGSTNQSLEHVEPTSAWTSVGVSMAAYNACQSPCYDHHAFCYQGTKWLEARGRKMHLPARQGECKRPRD